MFKPYDGWKLKMKAGIKMIFHCVRINPEYLTFGLKMLWVGFTDLLGITKYPPNRL